MVTTLTLIFVFILYMSSPTRLQDVSCDVEEEVFTLAEAPLKLLLCTAQVAHNYWPGFLLLVLYSVLLQSLEHAKWSLLLMAVLELLCTKH